MTRKPETVYFVGYARLPGNVASQSVDIMLSLELEVDSSTDLVVNASCSCIPPLGTKLIIDLLIGYELKKTLNGAQDEIRRRFFGPTQKAIIAALEKVHEGYLKYKNSISQEDANSRSPETNSGL